MLRNAEAQINKSTAELQEADLNLQASREEVHDVKDRLRTTQSRLQGAEALTFALQVQAYLETLPQTCLFTLNKSMNDHFVLAETS